MSDNVIGLPARAAAVAAAKAVEDDGLYMHQALGDALAGLPPRDRPLATHLASELVRWREPARRRVAKLSSRPMAEIDADIVWAVRLGGVQLFLADGVDDHAAVSTAVDWVASVAPSGAAGAWKGVVNGMLRGWQRGNVEPLGTALAGLEGAEAIADATAHPIWVVEDLAAQHGLAVAATVLEGDNVHPGYYLRLRRDTDIEGAVAYPDTEDVGAVGSLASVDVVHVSGTDPMRLPAVVRGDAIVQDLASMRVAQAVDAQAGERVLDLCAAPGGKTIALADAVGPTGRVLAVEKDQERAARLWKRLLDLGLDDRVRVLHRDGLDPLPDGAVPPGGFDRVLVDAPCTSLGTGRRRPDARWRREAGDAAHIAITGKRLAEKGWEVTRPGGRLVYSVCTWTEAETAGVVDAVADEFGQPSAQRQLLPPAADGMFFAVFDRPSPDVA